MNNKRHKFNKLKEMAYNKGYILEDCFISKYSYKTYKKEDNYNDCLLWKNLSHVEEALDNISSIEDINYFKNR